MESLLILIILSLLGQLWGQQFPRGYIYFRPEYQFVGEKAKGNWTRWFNSDNPFIYDEFAPGGDVETVPHQHATYGHHCDWGMPCSNPIGYELQLSHLWTFLYPDATLEQSMECTNLDQRMLTDVGRFRCSNLAQFDQNWEDRLPQRCFDYCQRSGQMYYGKQDPRWASNVLPNCRVCPDFAIRYFCLDSDMDCQTKEQWLEWYRYQIEVERQQRVGR